jgi:hypothetical protein
MAVCLECDVSIPQENIEKAWGALLELRQKINEGMDEESPLEHEMICLLDFIAQSVELSEENHKIGKKIDVTDRLRNSIFLAGFDGAVENGALTGLSPYADEFTEEANILFWKALAPFVKDGSEVVLQDDEGGYHRWRFSEGRFLEDELSHMVWEEDAEKLEAKDRAMTGALSNCLEIIDALVQKKLTVESLDPKKKAYVLQLIEEVRNLLGEA